jgi:thiol:disulfide interchange protein DsbD
MSNLKGQNQNLVTWNYSSKQIGDHDFELILTVGIENKWHIYSQFIGEGGPVPTSIKFKPSSDYVLVGKVIETPVPKRKFEEVFNMNVVFFEKEAIFTQKIKLNKASATINGSVEFMLCNDNECQPPRTTDFIFNIKRTN